jgi:hypothetical protein
MVEVSSCAVLERQLSRGNGVEGAAAKESGSVRSDVFWTKSRNLVEPQARSLEAVISCQSGYFLCCRYERRRS